MLRILLVIVSITCYPITTYIISDNNENNFTNNTNTISNPIEVKAVIWEGSRRTDITKCYIFIKNCTKNELKIARWPNAYNENYIDDKINIMTVHHDLGIVKYPGGYVGLAPDNLKMYIFDLTRYNEGKKNYDEFNISFVIDLNVNDNINKYSIDCYMPINNSKMRSIVKMSK